MDALSEVFQAARFRSGVFLRASFSEPWCLSSKLAASDCSRYLGPADHLVIFHYVIAGELRVQLEGRAVEAFWPGEAAVLPHNNPHLLAGREPATPVPAFDVVTVPTPGGLMHIDHGGGGDPTRIVCGFLGGAALSRDPLLAALPELMRFDSGGVRAGALIRTSLEFAADESAAGMPGTDAMLARVSELLLIEAVRNYAANLPDTSGGWLAAVRDLAVGRVLALMHAHPERPWTLEQLGKEAGVSRSGLGQRFFDLLGTPPMEYLTNWRLQLAARRLATGQAPIAEIAERVGYGSEAAFSRAFKRSYGVPPSTWRSTQRSV